jgi:hypothetical protein
LRPAAYPLPSTCNSINPSASPIFSFFDTFPSLSFFAFRNGVSQTKQTPDSRSNAVHVLHVTCPQTGATKTKSVHDLECLQDGVSWDTVRLHVIAQRLFARGTYSEGLSVLGFILWVLGKVYGDEGFEREMVRVLRIRSWTDGG